MAPPVKLDTLRNRLRKIPYRAGQTDSKLLRSQVVQTALAEAMSIYDADNEQGIITEALFSKPHFDAWHTPALIAWFAAELHRKQEAAAKAALKEQSVWTQVGTADFDEAVYALCSPHFIVSKRSQTDEQLYRIVDWASREVEPVGETPRDRITAFGRVVRAALAQDGVGISSPTVMNGIVAAFTTLAAPVAAPSLLGQPDELDWCIHRASIYPDARVPFPHIREFTDRLSDPEAFAAFIYGIYSGRNLGRQVLWISDSRGEGGKSKLISAITRALFGENICSSFPANSAITKNPHTNSAFLGKRLVIVGDANNRLLLHSPMFKELSGDDPSFVNVKYVQPFTTTFFCRCIVLSNYAPHIIADQHNRSRTLWLALSPLHLADEDRDPHYGEKCVAELPGFLAWAAACYERKCRNDYAIIPNERVRKAIDLRISLTETEFGVPFSQTFVLDEAGTVTAHEFTLLGKELGFDRHKLDDFHAWILARHTTVQDRFDAVKPTLWVMGGVRRRDPGDHWRAAKARADADRAPSPADTEYVFDTEQEMTD